MEFTHLLAVLAVPDVDAAVAGAGDDELRVGGEGRLQGQLLGVEVTWVMRVRHEAGVIMMS